MSITAIIFDLGGVIININVQKAFLEFCVNSKLPISESEKKLHEINHLFEIGHLTEVDFYRNIKEKLSLQHLSELQIKQLWNQVLLDIPAERIKLLLQLKRKYRIFLLSNTNSIHLKGVHEILYQTCHLDNLNKIFEKCYYSFEMNLRKPDPKIYETVISENGLLAKETLFIDDTHENAISAASVGLKSIYLCPSLTLHEALHDYV